ncbi:DNA-binding MarR family transcriptional regulator [Motilibacter rhizosphaerae]|uniref:DNA-binding MarR family transcriptional regulator n=1 Tax=Motilibacter rhizosphaerae TaxID=598652 RepID=A0A4Q7NUM4_9ACTN|nr:MarR family transcriptional regulator [Motilibacter rhizosphaerae]RZS90867.1 DNA-binding MarR family transcriptional regulator [Motilibacter rhizosphaerae]
MSRSVEEVALSVKRLQHRHHRALTAALADLGVSLVQWDVLRHLHAHPDASLHDLALLTFQTDQSFGTLAGRMVDRGLIERVPGPGRAVRHRITEAGEAVRAQGAERVASVAGRSFAGLDARELDQLGALLDRALESPAL